MSELGPALAGIAHRRVPIALGPPLRPAPSAWVSQGQWLLAVLAPRLLAPGSFHLTGKVAGLGLVGHNWGGGGRKGRCPRTRCHLTVKSTAG
jgi:hypothetical protein